MSQPDLSHMNGSSLIIAIDGPNGSGKGTLAKRLGEALKFPVLDTGLLYRAVGWLVKQHNRDLHNETVALKRISVDSVDAKAREKCLKEIRYHPLVKVRNVLQAFLQGD
jgi:cytidylate kinase